MKLRCICGASIHDVGDGQENKAYFIPDENWEAMTESIDTGKSVWNETRKYKRSILQCYQCCRIYIQNCNGEYESFKPDEGVEFGILKSI